MRPCTRGQCRTRLATRPCAWTIANVDVWYPVAKAAARGKPKVTYDQRTPLPTDLKSFVPDEFNTVVTMTAYKDITASAKGSFAVVLYSHGAGAHRMASSPLAAGIASWGFVVVSADYVERGVVTQLPGQPPLTLDPERDRRLMLELGSRHERERSVGIVAARPRRRHTRRGCRTLTGATTAFDALNDRRVKAAVGWAPSSPSQAPADKPTMIIGAANDLGVTPAPARDDLRVVPFPKRRVEIADSGHNRSPTSAS